MTNEISSSYKFRVLSWGSWLIFPSGHKSPHRAHHRGVHLAGKVEHAGESGQHLLALVVMVAEGNAQLIGNGPLLDPAHKDVHILFLEESGELQGVGIVHNDSAWVGDRGELLV